MTNNNLIYKCLEIIYKHKRFAESTTREFNEALIEMGWVEDGWETTLTEQGVEMLALLRLKYQK